MRPTSYALHIRPLFTDTDVAHMRPGGIDLSAHADVKANSATILTRVGGGPGVGLMPPRSTTGPWPEEWIALFRRWIGEGCPP